MNHFFVIQEEIDAHEKKIPNLEKQWLLHKQPIEEEKLMLEKQYNEKRSKMNEKLEQTKLIRQEIDELAAELALKENLIGELNKDMENNLKATNKNSTNRQFYTKRILEIMSNIDKQKKEINKVKNY
jgi:hypothetical protein